MTNFQSGRGRKCITRDLNLGVFRSAARADPGEDGLVKSVAESPVLNMRAACAWQPNGSLVANFFKAPLPKDPTKFVSKLHFSEKNGLQHGELPLPETRDFDPSSPEYNIQEIMWNKESEVMAVVTQQNSNILHTLYEYRCFRPN